MQQLQLAPVLPGKISVMMSTNISMVKVTFQKIAIGRHYQESRLFHRAQLRLQIKGRCPIAIRIWCVEQCDLPSLSQPKNAQGYFRCRGILLPR